LAAVEDRVRRLLEQRLYLIIPSNDTDLFATGLVDSLGLVELLIRLKEDLGVTLDIETVDFDELRSIESISQTVLAASSEAPVLDGPLS
jgi:acyl carrier protein